MKRIGFWIEYTKENPNYPSVESVKRNVAYEDKDLILKYLKSGNELILMGFRERYKGETIAHVKAIYTDGAFYWTSELIFFFEKFSIEIDDDFLSKIRADNYEVKLLDNMNLYRIYCKNENDKFDSTKTYNKEDAINIVKAIRSEGEFCQLYPAEYYNNLITEEEALKIAFKEYKSHTQGKEEKFGQLKVSLHTPIYFYFVCNDFELQKSGKVPGYYGILVDKISGKILTSDESREYMKLNYSF